MVKIDEDIRDKCCQNLENTVKEAYQEIRGYIELMKATNSLEEFMHLKKMLLLTWYTTPLIDADTCPFCVYLEMCQPNKCWYAKYHGQCSNPNSDWNKVKIAHEQFKQLLYNYYKGEQYDEKTED